MQIEVRFKDGNLLFWWFYRGLTLNFRKTVSASLSSKLY